MSRAKSLAKARAQSGQKSKSKEPAKTKPFLTGGSLSAILSLLLAAAPIALYSPVIWHSFLVFDDHDYVTANSHVHGGLRWSTIQWAFTSDRKSTRLNSS